MNTRFLRRATVTSVAAVALAVGVPLSASAHVRVAPDQAAVGSYAALTFRVPTESATAGTVKLEVDLPTDTPFSSVSYQPVAGWSVQVVTETLATPIKTDDGTVTEAPTKVIWTADPGVQIEPGQFQQFAITAGAVPDTGSIALPAHQYYSDGSVVDWDQIASKSDPDPEHPAPILYIKDAPPASGGQGATVSTSAGSAQTSDPLAIGLGIGGLALGVIALGLAAFAVARTGRAETTAKK